MLIAKEIGNRNPWRARLLSVGFLLLLAFLSVLLLFACWYEICSYVNLVGLP